MKGYIAVFVAAISCCAANALDTATLQARIDETSAKGGGRVSVPAGTHVVANLALRNGVELHLEKGCVLAGSTNRLDYGYPDQVRGLPSARPTGVVIAIGVTNVAITGKGVIDGRGTLYDRVLERGKGQYPKKMRGGWGCVRAFDCKGIRIEGVTMRDPVTWTCFLRRCEDVTVRGITIRSHANWNNDGLDLEVRNALIADCDIDSEDDALVFKTMDAGWETGNVKVRNCTLSSSASFLKFGTETKGAFRNYDIRGCRLLARMKPGVNVLPSGSKVDFGRTIPSDGACGSGGIVVAMVDGGQLENVTIRDIEIGEGVMVPIFVRLGTRTEPKSFDRTYLRNVTIENVRATAPSASRVASSVTGIPGLEVENVTLRNISLISPGGGTEAEAKAPVREAEKLYPSAVATFKSVLPAYGLYVRHAKGVRVENFRSVTRTPDARPMTVFADEQSIPSDETDAWQAKIDAISAAGGGRVTVPAGDHVVHGLRLKNGTELHLERSARLLAATNLDSYAWIVKTGGHGSVVFALGATNIAITGEGTIDGRGECFDRVITRQPHLKLRGGWKDVYLKNCRDVRIEDVTLLGATSWTCFLNGCDGVTVRRMKIRAHANFNNDGLDIQSSNVLVEDCDIDSEDDAVVIKANVPEASVRNVRVRRCRLSTNSSYIKFGTETKGSFKDVLVEDCRLECRTPIQVRSNHLKVPGVKDLKNGICGIEISMVDGGTLEDVAIRNIVMGDGINTPMMVRLGARTAPQDGRRSYLRDILIENVRMTEPATSFQACPVAGLPDLPLENVTFRNVDLLFRGGGTEEDARMTYRSERAAAYPTPPNVFKHILPGYAFYVRHAKGVRFENVRTRVLGEDARPAVVTEFADAAFEKCDFALPKGCCGREPVVRRKNVE